MFKFIVLMKKILQSNIFTDIFDVENVSFFPFFFQFLALSLENISILFSHL